MSHTDYPKFDHDRHARSRAETDFWGQIRRTVNGNPVDDEQIAMIVDRIMQQLRLQDSDNLLDLACGNGALASRLFGSLAGYVGVDLSETLIGVAKKYFENPPSFTFVRDSASDYVDRETDPGRFTKALCYGSFSYFSRDDASRVLATLHNTFKNVELFFIGNLPDLDRAAAFYGADRLNPVELQDNESNIGIWRTGEEFMALAARHGWKAELSVMPKTYYASHYRYDILLSR